jgi:hypothetical protein
MSDDALHDFTFWAEFLATTSACKPHLVPAHEQDPGAAA